MLLNIKTNAPGPGGIEAQSDPGRIMRLATIARGNAMLTTGETSFDLPPRKGDSRYDEMNRRYSARPKPVPSGPIVPAEVQALFDKVVAEKARLTEGGSPTNFIPDFDKPMNWFQAFQPTAGLINFSFQNVDAPSDMLSGEHLKGAVDVGVLQSDFWLFTHPDDKSQDELFYIQNTNLEFRGGVWPHIGMNRMFRKR
ncbi:MAG: hypothetical protein ACI8WB_005405 [Phenylobacterium sp.]|jgi:hypothetical protein